MDFFAQQDAARRHTTLLVFLFLLAVVAIVIAVNGISAFAFKMFADKLDGTLAPVPAGFFVFVTVATLAIIGIGSVVQIGAIASGGAAVARMLGARPVPTSSQDTDERRLLNVVEEMAIASGVSVPLVFVMDKQPSINAFAAGFSPNEAAVVVTRGTLQTLNRDELQGVIGHEFSHILNGDMRTNMRLMGVLGGILVLATIGRIVAQICKEDSKTLPLALLGVGLVAVGFIGVFFGRLIQAGLSRQREFLADASAVQFTRNPNGIGGALAKIAQTTTGARIDHPRADEACHMFFGEAVEMKFSDLMATHPPVKERLERIYGRPVLISDIVSRSMPPAPPAGLPEGAAVMEFAGGNEFGRSAGERRSGEAATPAMAQTAATVIAAMGEVSTRHVDYAASLLKTLPPIVREFTCTSHGAKKAMFGLVFALDGPARQAQIDLLREGGEDPEQVEKIAIEVQSLGKIARLPLIALAAPALKGTATAQRAEFLVLLQRLIEADRRVTLEEFVLATMLEASLGERAGRAVPLTYRTLEPLAEDARLVLSLIAHATTGDSAASFAEGLKELGLSFTLLDARAVSLDAVKAALGRLNQVAMMQKPRLVKALVQCALADGKLTLTDAELLRAICSTLDSPLPPFLEAMPYAA
jgi:Zn-dependent protease with chaperone function